MIDWQQPLIATLGPDVELAPPDALRVRSLPSEAPHELSRDGFELLLCFGQPCAPSAAFDTVRARWDLDRESLGAQLEAWLADGLLVSAAPGPDRLHRFVTFRQAIEAWDAIDRQGPFPLRSSFRRQQPRIFYPGLDAREVHDNLAHPWTETIEAAAPQIVDELDALLTAGTGFSQVYADATEQGEWAAAFFWIYGQRVDAICDRCPATTRALEAVPGATTCGTVQFSALAPGTRLTPHYGNTNAKLRCQLPLRVPPRCGLWAMHQHIPQIEGRCLVFDDSFLHSAWNASDQPRFILLFDFYHPALTPAEIDYLEASAFEHDLHERYLAMIANDQRPSWVYGGAAS